MFSNEFSQGMPFGLDNDIDVNINNFNSNMNELSTNMSGVNMGGCGMPVVETPQERVVHRNFVHEVPHVCPINTRVVNHHIYRHTYQPKFSCCEENVVTNEQCGSCCQFR